MRQPARDTAAARAPYRAERALTAGLLCGPGGAAAHVAAGGQAPDALTLAAVTAVALLGAAVAASRRLGAPVLLALAGGAQLVFHQVFGPAPTAGPGSGTAHDMTHGMAPGMAHGADGGTSMLLAHVAVALAVAAVAGGTEAGWWALARAALLRLLPALPATPAAVPVVGVRPRPVEARPVRAGAREEPDVVGPRGPPGLAAPSATPAPTPA